MEIKTFAEFIKCYNIEIPIIQRDYVYGRERCQGTGTDLVSDIVSSIKNNKILDLNFIYGIETSAKAGKNYYFPIDGQQRLTTLFLFYWYVSIKSGHKEEFFQLNPEFSYKTRSSAREFFMWISDSNNKELLALLEDRDGDIAEEMRDMPGFKASWNYDNTVKSCIFILNQIARLLCGEKVEEYYRKLNTPKECSLKFTIINENGGAVEDVAESTDNKNSAGMGKTGDIAIVDEAKAKANKTYIRMNARGKALTDFEKIKSMVDSLEAKGIEDNEKFSYKYDTEYINSMYEYAKEPQAASFPKNTPDLEEITKTIDKMSRVFFINMFRVLCVSLEEEFDIEERGNNMAKDITGNYIRKLKGLRLGEETADNAKKEEKAKKYIDLMNYYMRFLLENKKYASKAFQTLGMGSEFSNIFAEAWYVFHFMKKHRELPSADEAERFQLILKNLRYSVWTKDKYKIVEEFSGEIASYKDWMQYFCREQTCREFVKACGLQDIEVRWKEHVLLAKCCSSFINNTVTEDNAVQNAVFGDYKSFEKYRNMAGEENGKLQFVLWAAGIWDAPSQASSDFPAPADVKRFIDCLKRYAEYRKDELLWRQDYAVAAYVQRGQEGFKLLEDGRINAVPKESPKKNAAPKNVHIWENGWYEWNDDAERKEEYRLLLKTARLVYEMGAEKLGELKNKLAGSKSTWLGYAIAWSNNLKEQAYNDNVCKELFKGELINQDDQHALGAVRYETDKKPFMMHIFKISRRQYEPKEYDYGWKDWTKVMVSKTYAVHLKEKPYNEYVANKEMLEYYNFRNCNINIRVDERVKGKGFKDLPSDKELCLFDYKENSGLYYIYEYQPNTPDRFKQYEYDMKAYLEDCKKNKEVWKSFDLTTDDLLITYQKCGGWNSNVIDEGKINKNNTCELWKKSRFEKSNINTYEFDIIYPNEIPLANSAEVLLK